MVAEAGCSSICTAHCHQLQEYGGRPKCIYCGWCISGCPTEAKATSANTYLAKAERLGVRVITDAFVHRVVHDADRATGVLFLDSQRREHRVHARLIVLAAHAIKAPRLLLMSDSLANSSGLVGKNFMSHPTWQVFGNFDEPINAFKQHANGARNGADYKPNPANHYAQGFILLSYMMTPATLGISADSCSVKS